MSQTSHLTININQELKKQAKSLAKNLGISLSSLIENLLDNKIKKDYIFKKPKFIEITHKGVTFMGPKTYNKKRDLPLNNSKEINYLTSKIRKTHEKFIKNGGKIPSLKKQLGDLL